MKSSNEIATPSPRLVDGVDLSPPAPGRMLPPRVYSSSAIYELEQARIFASSWVHVADLCDVVDAGDYVAASIGRSPVIIVRGRDGQLRGFLNACRHRGATLLEGRGRCDKQIKCPYHAWSYTLDGKLVGVPYREEFDCDFDELGLVEIRVGVVGPMIFACLDHNAPSLEAWVGELPAALQRIGTDSWRLAYEVTFELEANWKLFVENSNDGYHVQFVHDILTDVIDFKTEEPVTVCEPHSAYTYARINPTYLPPEVDPNEVRLRFGQIFPNLTPVLSPADLTYLRVDPISPGRSRVIARSFDGLDDAAPLREFRRQAFVRTTEQDVDVVQRTHRGLLAHGLPAGVHSNRMEGRIGHFQRLVALALGADAHSVRLPLAI